MSRLTAQPFASVVLEPAADATIVTSLATWLALAHPQLALDQFQVLDAVPELREVGLVVSSHEGGLLADHVQLPATSVVDQTTSPVIARLRP